MINDIRENLWGESFWRVELMSVRIEEVMIRPCS